MSASVINDDDGWQVVTKKKPTRTETAPNTKGGDEKPKKKNDNAPSRTNTSVSGRHVHVTVTNAVTNALADSASAVRTKTPGIDNAPTLEPVRLNDALHVRPPPTNQKSLKDMEPKERKKEKRARMIAAAALAARKANAQGKHRGYGQGNKFGANPAPERSWRASANNSPTGSNKGGKKKSKKQVQETTTDGNVVFISDDVTHLSATTGEHVDEDFDEDDLSDYDDDLADYSDSEDEEEPNPFVTQGELHVPASVALAAAKPQPRSILRTSTSGQIGGVAFDNAVHMALTGTTETNNPQVNKAASAPMRSSTVPGPVKYVPPHHKPKDSKSDKETKVDEVVSADEPLNTNTNTNNADASSQKEKPKRTNTAGSTTSYHKKGTPGVFKNKDRQLDDNWRVSRQNTQTDVKPSNAPSRTNTNTNTNTTTSPNKKKDKADKTPASPAPAQEEVIVSTPTPVVDTTSPTVEEDTQKKTKTKTKQPQPTKSNNNKQNNKKKSLDNLTISQQHIQIAVGVVVLLIILRIFGFL